MKKLPKNKILYKVQNDRLFNIGDSKFAITIKIKTKIIQTDTLACLIIVLFAGSIKTFFIFLQDL